MLYWTFLIVVGAAVIVLFTDWLTDLQSARARRRRRHQRDKQTDATIQRANEVMDRVDVFLQEIGRQP
jgi:hypothetical protein